MLKHTLLVWTNELGKRANHLLHNIPIVMVDGGAVFKMGRSLKAVNGVHNRRWLAPSMGHDELQTFGKGEFSAEGALSFT